MPTAETAVRVSTVELPEPDAFDTTGWAFGLGYFVVNLVHSGLFLLSGGPAALRPMRSLGGFTPLHGAMRCGRWPRRDQRPSRRARTALTAFGYCHYPVLVGIIAVAAAAGQIAVLVVVLAVPLSVESYRQVKATGVRAVIWRR